MPIRAAEPDCYPANLLDDYLLPDFAKANEPRRWWAAYTLPRQEKSLARQLLAMEIPFYLPLVSQVRFVRGRRQKSFLPVFSSYVFVCATDDQRIGALETNRIAQLFSTPHEDGLTRDLRNIRALIESGEPLTLESRLQAGQRVRVKNGALEGIEGTIVERRGEERLLVSVEFLQQGVSILISDYQVERS
jgi:transcriptional antiterminator RfaH